MDNYLYNYLTLVNALLGTSNGKQTNEDVNQPNRENHVNGLGSDLAADAMVISDLKENVETDLGKNIIYIYIYIYINIFITINYKRNKQYYDNNAVNSSNNRLLYVQKLNLVT